MPDPAGYEFVRSLGIGSMGPVYLARQVAHNREVAVKRILGAWSGDPEELERFHREARVLARMNHPNIVGVDEVVGEGSDLFVVSDYVRGASLRQLMSRSDLTRTQALNALAEVSRALTYAAGRSILHGDLKPSNVFITLSGVGKVADFGLVKMLAGSSSLVSATGAILGTPAYMSPEHAAGRSDIGPRADIYSMAVMAYELLVGQLPFPSVQGNVAATLDAHLTAQPPHPSTIVPNFPSPIEEVLLNGLAKEPSQRPATADDFWKHLAAAAGTAWPGWASEDEVALRPVAEPELPELPIEPTIRIEPELLIESELPIEPELPMEPAPAIVPTPIIEPAGAETAVSVQPVPAAEPEFVEQPAWPAPPSPELPVTPTPPSQPPPPPPPPPPPKILEGQGPAEADEVPGREEREIWPLVLALFIFVVAAAGVLAVFPLHLFRNGSPLHVESVSAVVTPTSGHCPSARYDFTASVVTNGHGGPVTYEWAKPDQRRTDVKSASIPDGEKNATATLEFTFQGQGSTAGDAVLHILTPNDVQSAPVHITYQCP